jgi:hypothetical protein
MHAYDSKKDPFGDSKAGASDWRLKKSVPIEKKSIYDKKVPIDYTALRRGNSPAFRLGEGEPGNILNPDEMDNLLGSLSGILDGKLNDARKAEQERLQREQERLAKEQREREL